MTSEVTINGRSITGWRKYAILAVAIIGVGVTVALTYLAIIPLLVFCVLFALPVALLSWVFGGAKE